MKRREFLKSSSVLTLYFSTQNLIASEENKGTFLSNLFGDLFESPKERVVLRDSNEDVLKVLKPKDIIVKKVENKTFPKIEETIVEEGMIKEDKTLVNNEKEIKSHKDVFIDKKNIEEFVSVREKLKLVQNHVGYGNFNIISFDEMLKVAKYSNKIESYTKKELEFLESIFYYDPKYHGFYGRKVSDKITQKINKNEVSKIPYTGHYLFKGEPEKIYNRMVEDIGDSLVLTSGVRSIVKQTKLFLDKIDSVDGNMSVASKSLAPPAYTYHSIADFDVGKKGFGYDNFTSRFALTEEFQAMRKLKYIDMRYTINNKDGVRYEPWHVKII